MGVMPLFETLHWGALLGDVDCNGLTNYLLHQGVVPKQIFISVSRSSLNVSLASVGAVRNALSSVGCRGSCGAGWVGGN